MMIAILKKLLLINIVASSFREIEYNRTIRLLAAVLSSSKSCISFGVKEKYATSDPETNAEQINKITSNTHDSAMLTGETNTIRTKGKACMAERGGSVSKYVIVGK
jgi:hypothetical protein